MAADQEATSLPRLQVLGIVLGSPAQLAGMRQVGSGWEVVRKQETGYRVPGIRTDLRDWRPHLPTIRQLWPFDTQGDEIVTVNGTAVAGSSPFETSSLIQSSSKGQGVTIQVLHPRHSSLCRDRWEATIGRLIAFRSLCSIAMHTVSALPLPLSPSPGNLT